MIFRIFAVVGVAVVGMLITGALSESFGPIAMAVGLTFTAVAVFTTWGKMKEGEQE